MPLAQFLLRALPESRVVEAVLAVEAELAEVGMATRDRSQGFGFVYMNLGSLLSKKEWAVDDAAPIAPAGAKVLNFNKDTNFVPSTPAPTPPAPPAEPTRAPIEQIRENLDRLQTLHHRIHVMLEELNTLSGRKKDPKGDS